MRQNPVGEPAATAALTFDTPLRRSSSKRFGPLTGDLVASFPAYAGGAPATGMASATAFKKALDLLCKAEACLT
jgi:hypothetical protein